MRLSLLSRYTVTVFGLVILSACFFGCAGNDRETKASPGYLSEIETWQAERINRLTSKTGWLTLCGLYWLKEGENTFGSGQSNSIKFPAGKAPDHIGSVFLENNRIITKIAHGLAVYHADSLVREIEMQPDISGRPTTLRLDSLSWFIIKRGERVAIRLRDTENDRLREFEGINRFPVDSIWRITARLAPYKPAKIIDVPDIIGMVSQSNSPGALVFEIGGKSYRLDPLGEPGDKKLFLIFADQTNGSETYGAGRFLSVDWPGSDGLTVIDFNKAYNPPCAFTPYATCPLPPAQNVLTVAVTAGEKNYGSH